MHTTAVPRASVGVLFFLAWRESASVGLTIITTVWEDCFGTLVVVAVCKRSPNNQRWDRNRSAFKPLCENLIRLCVWKSLLCLFVSIEVVVPSLRLKSPHLVDKRRHSFSPFEADYRLMSLRLPALTHKHKLVRR